MRIESMILTTTLVACVALASGGITWYCGDQERDKFRCDKEECLYTTTLLCSRYLSPDCENGADQWTAMCDNMCPDKKVGNRTVKSFKCGEGICEEDFLKWCNGVVDCESGIDEAHCNCTANPVDCSQDWKNRRESDHLEIIIPIAVLGGLVLLVLLYTFCNYCCQQCDSEDSDESENIELRKEDYDSTK